MQSFENHAQLATSGTLGMTVIIEQDRGLVVSHGTSHQGSPLGTVVSPASLPMQWRWKACSPECYAVAWRAQSPDKHNHLGQT